MKKMCLTRLTLRTMQVLIFSLLFIFTSCQHAAPMGKNLSSGWNANLKISDVDVDIYLPQGDIRYSLLLLPGWNFDKRDWINKTDILERANRRGIILILPQMKKSIYATAWYPETRMKWGSLPGSTYIKEKMIPHLQKEYNLLIPGQRNFILGLSTGGRGVAMTVLENPGIFSGAAALSGDYMQEHMTHDNLMKAVYGSYEKFKDRWTGRDNPGSRASEWTIPLYLAHGSKDRVVPVSQSRLFYEQLRKKKTLKESIVFDEDPGAAHDYKFWEKGMHKSLHFFNDLL